MVDKEEPILKDTLYSTLDYPFMRTILERLDAAYPAAIRTPWESEQDESKIVRHLSYLLEYGFISTTITQDKRGNHTIGRCRITPRGIDFLQSDGGLSALAAPTIRISTENLLSIIDTALTDRNIPAAQRSFIQNALGIAGTEGLKVIVQRLVNAGIAHTSDIVRMFTLP